MRARSLTSRILIGPKPFDTLIEYKRSILRGQLGLISMMVGVGYFLVDTARGVTINYPFHAAVFILGAVTIILNRYHHHFLASFIFISLLNLVVFVFCSSESYKSGAPVFFICCSLTAFALFSKIAYAFSFSGVSFVLFALSLTGEVDIIPYRDFPDDYLHSNFGYNFAGAIITCVLIVYFLISVNRQSEEKILEQNRLLFKTNQELDQFVYSASHDLRAPLSTIRGLVQLYSLTENEKDKSDIIQMINERAVKMDAFIADILNYSRNARSEINLETFEILPFLREVSDGLSHMKPSQQDVVTIHVPAYEIVRTDKRRLKIIVSNLLSNALKYARRGVNHRVSIIYWKENGHWFIKITDNGTGIRKEYQSRIFEMFYRASDQSDGSGLGLYIVKECLDRVDGTITLESTVDEGSSFTIGLPIL